jgi:uncharacterized protein HemX
MAGSISATTATLIAAGVAAGSTGYSIYAGQKAAGAQKKALAAQTTAQQQAESNALSSERKSELAESAVNQQKPNVAAILARAATMGNGGLSSTMLTGPTGVSTGSLNLGKTSLLGA